MAEQPQSLTIIHARWPVIHSELVRVAPLSLDRSAVGPEKTLTCRGIHLSSCYDRRAEARLQASLVPEQSETAWIYGPGMGDLPRMLLARPTLKKITVVLLNRALFVATLDHEPMDDWLADPRVELDVAGPGQDIAAPFATVPSELVLAEDDALALRDSIMHILATPFVNRRHEADTASLLARAGENRDLLRRDGDAAELTNIWQDRKVLIAAAGPSLARHFGAISDLRRTCPLIAVDAALTPLLAHGIVPDIVVTIDSFREGVLAFFERASASAATLAHSILVYFPIVHRDVLNTWPGKRLAAFGHGPLYDNPSIASDGKQRLFSQGSVLHPAIDLAVLTGASEVVLFGADFSHVGGRTNTHGSPADAPSPLTAGSQWQVVNSAGKRVPTTCNMISYLRELEHYIEKHDSVRFYNADGGGAVIRHTRRIVAAPDRAAQ